MRQLTFVTLTSAFIISGCAGMSAEQCQLADWETIGFEDGTQGAPGERIAQHRKSCAKAGVAPDRLAYERGRQEGLLSYCQPGNGYRVGAAGQRYLGVCTADSEPEFLRAYDVGMQHYQLRADVSQLKSQINYEHRQEEKLRDRIAAAERDLVADGLNSEERIALLLELKNDSQELGETEQKTLELQRELARAELELEHFEQRSYASTLW